MLMVVNYGKGRVFHTALGHDVTAQSSLDFVVTLQRGVEWAATGKVTAKVAPDFPTDPNTLSTRIDLLKLDPAYNNNQPPSANAGGRGRATGPAPVFTNGRMTADQFTTVTLPDGTVVTRQPDGTFAPATRGGGAGGRRGGGPAAGGAGGPAATPPPGPCDAY
jgi:hypothetical protein